MKLKITNTFECDEKIADIIIKLYKKGYITEFCCSGHPKDLKPYIAFNKNASIELHGAHPVNWVTDNAGWKKDDTVYNCYIIKRKFTLKERIKYSSETLIDKAMVELESWVDSLPPSIFCHLYNEYEIEKI